MDMIRNTLAGGDCCCAPSSVPEDDASFQPYSKSRHVDDDRVIGTQAILARNHGVSNNDEDYSKVKDAVANVPTDDGLDK